MKRAVIVGLLALNVVLLAGLLFAPDKPAYGQAVHGATDYLTTTAHFGRDYDALFVVDLAKRKMVYFLFDRTTKKMVPYGLRKLYIDFPVAP